MCYNALFMTFSNAKFAKFFAAATLMAAVTFAIGNIIQLVSSWYLGTDAFAAMAAVYPYRLLPDVIVILVAEGAAALSAQAIGRGDRETANRVFSQGATVLAALGVVFTLGFHAFEGVYLDVMGVTGAVREQALAFGRGFVFSILSGMLQDYTTIQVYADGGQRHCLAGSIVFLFVHAATAVLFVSRWGAEGLGWSVAVSTCAYFAVLLLHFRTDRASLRFRPFFSPRLFVRTCALGLTSLLPQLETILVSCVTARVAATRFGAVGLAVVAVVNSLGSVVGFLQAVGRVTLPLAAVSFGENNRLSLVATMRRALRYLLAEGLLLTLPLVLFPNQIAGLFGIADAPTRAAMSAAIFWIGLFLVPAGLASLWGTYLQATSRVRTAAAYTFLRSFVFPAGAILLCILAFGTSGLAAATAGEAAFLCVFAAVGWVIARRHGLTCPLFLPRSKTRGLLLSLEATGESAARAAARVGETLERELGAADRRTLWASLATEELLTVTADINRGRRVRVELSLDFPDEDTVRLIFRDDGRIFDFAAAASDVNSLSAFVLTRLSCRSEQHSLTATGNNRSQLLFPKDMKNGTRNN